MLAFLLQMAGLLPANAISFFCKYQSFLLLKAYEWLLRTVVEQVFHYCGSASSRLWVIRITVVRTFKIRMFNGLKAYV